MDAIFTRLVKKYPHPEHYITWDTPEQLLVATILSAQCTDTQVNKVTPHLFRQYHSPTAFAHAPLQELETMIRSTGFFHVKAKSIIEANRVLIKRHKGKLPKTMSELLQLPGVGRKTANALLQNAFGIVEGIVVDTHVIRLANRFWWSKSKNASRVERDLMRHIPKNHWMQVPGVLKAHGKAVCKAPIPRCKECFLNSTCPSAFQFLQYSTQP